MVITDFVKDLLFWIFIVIVLLSFCMALDSADEDVVVTANHSQVNVTNCTVVDGVHYDTKIVKDKDVGVAKLHKVITTKPKYPVITMTGKPSCSCGRYSSYTWRTRSYVNYCPYCHRYGTLYNAHKWQSRFEKEITCRRCSADFCINCGKEKMGYSRKYLRRA